MIKIIGKIDVSNYRQPPRPEISGLKFDGFLENYSQKINKEFSGLLQSDVSINPNHPDYNQEQLRMDTELVNDKERMWAGGNLPEYLAKKERNPATIAEKAIASLLIKFLGERFIVARASKYDDYENRIDLVLIDKQTGAVVCGLDEVLGHQGDDGALKKGPKMEKIYKRQGLELRYGATIENGKLKRKSFRHLPAFYVSLSKQELGALCQKFNGDDISQPEKEIFSKIINSLQEQYDLLEKEDFHLELVFNLQNFKKSLELMKMLQVS